MTPEGKILAHTKKECKRLALRFVRISFGPGGEAGWPDVIVIGPEGADGQVLWLETKSLGKPLRPLQAHRRDEIRARGGNWAKPDTKEDVTAYLEAFLRVCEREKRDLHTVPGAPYV